MCSSEKYKTLSGIAPTYHYTIIFYVMKKLFMSCFKTEIRMNKVAYK